METRQTIANFSHDSHNSVRRIVDTCQFSTISANRSGQQQTQTYFTPRFTFSSRQKTKILYLIQKQQRGNDKTPRMSHTAHRDCECNLCHNSRGSLSWIPLHPRQVSQLCGENDKSIRCLAETLYKCVKQQLHGHSSVHWFPLNDNIKHISSFTK